MNDYFRTVKSSSVMHLRSGKDIKKEFEIIQSLIGTPKHATIQLDSDVWENTHFTRRKTQDGQYFTVTRTRSRQMLKKSNRNRTYERKSKQEVSHDKMKAASLKRKRSAKEDSKEKDQSDLTQYFWPYQLRNKPLAKNHVTFKNSNINEIFEYKSSDKGSKSKKIDAYFSKSKKIDGVPPKSKRRRHNEEDEGEWDKNDSKSKLNKSRSHINIEPERFGNRYARYLTKRPNFDEKHYESVREYLNTKVPNGEQSIHVSNSKDELKTSSHKFSEKNEYLKIIRKRGEEARQKRATTIQKTTSEKKIWFTPEVNKEIIPIPFPSFEAEEKQNNDVSFEIVDKPEEIPITTSDTQKSPIELVDKVQYQKDISVPLIKEIQSIPVFDVSFDIEGSHQASAETQIEDVVMEQQVISEIKEIKNNIRTPAKVTNKPKFFIEVSKAAETQIKEFDFKSPLPKKKHSVDESVIQAKNKEIIHTFALRIDAKEILKEFDDIVLPKKLQLIFEFFYELDNAINSCKRRGKIPIMSNIKPYIEQATSRSFTNDQFAQVLYVAPELYYYTWQESQGSNSYELRIEIPENIEEIMTRIGQKEFTVSVKYSPLSEPMTNFLINKRKILFRSRLILYIEKLHKSYLNSRGIKNYDFIEEKGWHQDFDRENIIDIPPKQLKNMPKLKKTESISDFLKNRSIKNALLKRVADTINYENSPEQFNFSPSTQPESVPCDSGDKKSSAKINSGWVSPTFYKKIEAKEKLYAEEKKNIENDLKMNSNKRKQELMLKIAHAVKNVFSVNGNLSTLFLNNVLKYLNDSQRGNFYDKKELFSTIKELSEIVPEWLTMNKHERGFLIKISNKVKLPTIRNKILSHTQ